MKRLKRQEGSNLVEFALVLPLLLILVMGIVEVGLAIYDKAVITNACREGARAGIIFREQRLTVIASLPCYLEENVDQQRGKGVFTGSIVGLKRLNALGYGKPGSALELSLVYNPQGPSLPPAQPALEEAYRAHLGASFGVEFTRLYTLANMPIQRFGSTLVSKGQFDAYMELLRASHRDENLGGVMCRTLLSVDWQGNVYDCDFNQMLGIPLAVAGRRRVKLAELIGRDLSGNPIAVADHCYGCTAGQGSSCGGALS